jgi:hypothetical protein
LPAGWYSPAMGKPEEPPKAVRIDSWGFEGSWGGHRRGRGIPLLGIFLIVLGLLLAGGQLFPQAQFGTSAFFLAIGVILVLVGIRDRSDLALYSGVFVGALALSDLLSTSGVIEGPGWGKLFLGLGVVAVALIRFAAGRHLGWALVLGGLLALWGGSEVASSNLNFSADRLIGPLLIVLLGVYIVSRSRVLGR